MNDKYDDLNSNKNVPLKSTKNLKEPFNQIASEEDYLVIASMTNFFHLLDTINNKEKEIAEKEKKKAKKDRLEMENNSKGNKDKSNARNQGQSSLIEMKQIDFFQEKLDAQLSNNSNNPSDRIPFNEQENNGLPLAKNQQDLSSKSSNKPLKPLKYFVMLRVFVFIFLTLNGCYTWILYYMISAPRNRYYCFNPFSKEFKPCALADFCPHQGHIDIIYTNDLFHNDTITEAKMVNDEYLPFYIKDTSLFSLLNKKYSKTESISSYYSVVIILTKRENYQFANTFRSNCQGRTYDFFITLLLAMTIGNVTFGLLADLIGRKKLLLTLIVIEVIGGMILAGETAYILSTGISNGSAQYNQNDQMFNFTKESYLNVSSFINSINRAEFDMANLTQIYKERFYSIKSKVLEGLFIQRNFKQYKLFIFLGVFFIYLCNSSIFTISLAYFMENAVTEDFFYNNNIILHSAKPASIFLTFLLVTQIDSFYIPLFIINCCLVVMAIIFIIFFYESQRFNLEYCYYVNITRFAESIFGKEQLKRDYLEKDLQSELKKEQEPFNAKGNKDNKQKEEEKKKAAVTLLYHKSSPTIETEYSFYLENKNSSLCDSLALKYTIENEMILTKKSMKKQTKKENALRRDKILSSPFKHLTEFMNSEKQIKNHFLIIIAFISVTGIVSHLCYGKIMSILFYSRVNLINNDIWLTNIFIFCIISIFIILGYNWVMKFLGPNTILIASFVIIILFSIIFEILGLMSRERTDLNKTLFNSYEVVVENHYTALATCLYFCLIGATGLIIGMYFFITKLTKTIYRCTFYGYAQIFVDVSFVMTIGLEMNIEKTFFYVCLFSIIGLINTFFISTNADAVIIKDYRQINYDEKKEKRLSQ